LEQSSPSLYYINPLSPFDYDHFDTRIGSEVPSSS
jgi:hypothetical protein